MTNQYVTIYEEYQHKFFQIPQVFFVSDLYKGMSSNAKLAYALLRDRSSLSRKNGWFDKDTGRIYFKFSNESLMQILNIGSNTTLSNIKKELIKTGLLESVRQGVNQCNKLYLLYPVVTDEDVYRIDRFIEIGLEKEEKSYQQASTLDNSGRTESVRPESVRPDVQKVYASNTNFNNTKSNLDTIDTETDFSTVKLNGSSISEQDDFMINAFFRNNRIPEQLGRCLKVFSSTLEEAEYYASLIYRAKKEVEKSIGFCFDLEDRLDVEMAVVDSFTRAIRKTKKVVSEGKRIENTEAYMYKCIYSALTNIFNENMNIGSLFTELESEDEVEYTEQGVKVVPLYDFLEIRE